MNLTTKMKMKLLLLALAALAAISNAYGQNRTVAYVDTLATLDARRPIPGETVYVRGASAVADWGNIALPFSYSSTSSNAISRFCRAVSTGVGRYIYDWDGDVAPYVLPGTNDCGPALTQAIADATLKGLPARIIVPGDYYLTSTNGIQLVSNSRLIGSPGVRIVGNYNAEDGSGYATPAKAFIRNSGNTGYQFSGEIVVVNTNISIEGIEFIAANTNAAGFPFSMVGVDGLDIKNCKVSQSYEAWAFQICSHNVSIIGCEVYNPGSVYQDGIHIDGGNNGLISDCRLRTGDDGVAFGQHAIPIRRWTVQNIVLHSDFGHFFRGYIGTASATNFIEDIVITGMTGITGSRNAMGRIESASTNVSYPFKRWSVSGIRGINQQSNTAPVGFDAGYSIENADDVKLDDLTVPFSKQCNFFFRNCGRALLTRSKGLGTGATSYQQSIRVETVEDMTIRDVEIQNSNTNSGSYALYVLSTGKFTADNVDLAAYDNALTIQTVDEFKFSGGRLISTNARPISSTVNPTNLFLQGNFIGGALAPAWAGGSPPVTAQISGNIGVTVVAAVNGTSFDAYTSAGNWLGKFTTEENNKLAIVSTNGQLIFKQDEIDGGSKNFRLSAQASTNSVDNPNAIAVASDTSSFSILSINGGSSLLNGHRWLQFYATGTNRTPGTIVSQFSYPTTTNGTLLETSLRLNFAGSNGVSPYTVYRDTNGFLKIP